ncbi:hypothetical protein [Halobacillus sp. A5]|uniref:hypothetical protein n=1 Tax=Halobacillus sp. A5 TaxID=2880263 RepID=UPI0020A66698|nr:hypothetical protein [Halobacillus sp. A5]MCP3026265.1 hypothetical protein [Halobacillus sp. A5]
MKDFALGQAMNIYTYSFSTVFLWTAGIHSISLAGQMDLSYDVECSFADSKEWQGAGGSRRQDNNCMKPLFFEKLKKAALHTGEQPFSLFFLKPNSFSFILKFLK